MWPWEPSYTLHGKSLEGAQLLCEAEDLNPSDPHPMEILADTEIVPPALAPKITSQLASLHKRYPNDGLILFDYTMVQSGRWSNDKAATASTFHRVPESGASA